MKKQLLEYYSKQPLMLILFAGLFLRLLAAIFAQGYGMHDDHFLIIETSHSWTEGYDYNRWLPAQQGDNAIPQGHSLMYPVLMFVFFKILCFLGIENLATQMYFVRILHALYSLFIIIFAYKITLQTSSRRIANYVGWTLSLLWCLPWLSVRNLVEIVSIPPLLGATYYFIKNDKWSNVVFSAVLMGVAFAFRFQIIFFIGGFGLAMLINKKWKAAAIWTIVLLISFFLTQISDLVIWKRPFSEMQEYIRYNLESSGSYPQGNYFTYLLVVLGVLLPPVSVLLFFGFFKEWKRLYLFLPAFAFLFFHTIFPNRQERFIFPILPSIILLGFIRIENIMGRKWVRICFVFSLVLNMILLFTVTFHYSHKDRVETMSYLYKYRHDENFQSFIVENPKETRMFPRTYLGKEAVQYDIEHREYDKFRNRQDLIQPMFIIFEGGQDLQRRTDSLRTMYPDIVFEKEIKPSPVDALLQKINPKSRNYTNYIYRIKN